MRYAVYEHGFLEEIFSDLNKAIDYAETVCNNAYNTIVIVYQEDEEIIEYLFNNELRGFR